MFQRNVIEDVVIFFKLRRYFCEIWRFGQCLDALVGCLLYFLPAMKNSWQKLITHRQKWKKD